jgi:hypothetical protein
VRVRVVPGAGAVVAADLAAAAVSEPGEHRAEVVPLRASDIHYELALDDEPPPGPPVLVDPPPPETGTALLPVIPKHLSTAAGLKASARRQAALHRHRILYHGVRSPRYAALTTVYAVRGLGVAASRQAAWGWEKRLHMLLGEAAAAKDTREAMRLHKELKQTRSFRGWVLLAEGIVLAAGCTALAVWGRWQADTLVIVIAWVVLAQLGRPAGKPIISSATVTPRFRRLSADVVLRAYYAADLGHPDKPDQQVTFGSTMQRDGEGSRVVVILPYGKGLKDAIERKDKIASGLDVTESQVFLHRDKTSYRLHTLWVADRDPLAVPVGRTPLLACKQTDVWKPGPLGLDERGQLIKVGLLWNSLLVGALPRMGKTFAARLLALFAALDPHVKLDVFDASGKPDWRKFALVADSCAFGLTPTREGKPPEILLGTLERIRADVEDRYERLSGLPTHICPEGKLTREIARDPRFRMPVRLLVLDEVQEYFDLGDISKAIADLLIYLVKVAPGAGVSVISATQRPSGIGSGEVRTKFTAFRDMHQLRFSLRTPDWRVSEMVLGAGSLGEGADSSKLLPEYKGVGILRGASDASPTVRCHLADHPDAEKILTAARAIRERAGTLSGMALGESMPEAASILADVVAVLGDLAALPWELVAQFLAQRWPDQYGDANAESVSARCRAAGVRSVDVKYQGRALKGCRREHVMALLGQGGAG